MPHLLNITEIEDWQKDNEYIHNYYRPQLNSHLKCWQSIFYLHNQTVNIWSHLVPAVPVLVMALVYLSFAVLRYKTSKTLVRLERGLSPGSRSDVSGGTSTIHPTFSTQSQFSSSPLVPSEPSHSITMVGTNLASKIAASHNINSNSFEGWKLFRLNLVLCLFYLNTTLMLFFSSLFHTELAHSSEVKNILSGVDYSGVLLMIASGLSTYVYLTFYHNLIYKSCYIIFICLSSITCIVIMNDDAYANPEYRTMRGALFMGLGCSALIPVVHLLVAHGFRRGVRDLYIGHLAMMGATYLVGAALYVKRFPENLFPGQLDLVGNSHNLLHLCVIIATGILVYIIERLRYEKVHKDMHKRGRYMSELTGVESDVTQTTVCYDQTSSYDKRSGTGVICESE